MASPKPIRTINSVVPIRICDNGELIYFSKYLLTEPMHLCILKKFACRSHQRIIWQV